MSDAHRAAICRRVRAWLLDGWIAEGDFEAVLARELAKPKLAGAPW